MTDHSQYDVYSRVLKPYFEEHSPVNHRLVDVGAYGQWLSNTYGFIADHGWHGLMVEPHEETFAILSRDYTPFASRVDLAQCAVSDYAGMGTLHIHNQPGQHSLREDWYPPTATDKTQSCQVFLLADLLDAYEVPLNFDLLAVDTEGEDDRVLLPMLRDSDYRPQVVVFEHIYQDEPRLDVLRGELKTESYVEHYSDFANSIHVLSGDTTE